MNMDEAYNLPESLRKSIELQNRLQEGFKPILEQQARIQQLTAPLLNSLSTSNLAVSALNGLDHMTESPAVPTDSREFDANAECDGILIQIYPTVQT